MCWPNTFPIVQADSVTVVRKPQPEMSTLLRTLSSAPGTGKGKWGLALSSSASSKQDPAVICQAETYFCTYSSDVNQCRHVMLFFQGKRWQKPAGLVICSHSSFSQYCRLSSTLFNIKLPLLSVALSIVSDIKEHIHLWGEVYQVSVTEGNYGTGSVLRGTWQL